MIQPSTNHRQHPKRTVQEIRGHTTKSQEEEHLYHITTTPNPQTTHTHKQRERERAHRGRREPTAPTAPAGHPATDRASERAATQPRTADETASDRATNTMLYTIEFITIILGVARPVGERKEEMDVRPPDFSWGVFFLEWFEDTSERERPTRPRGWMSDIYAFYILSFLF